MNEYEKMIIQIVQSGKRWVSLWKIIHIKDFISNCSISDFEKLKEMDYDLSTKSATDETAQ